MAKRRKFCFFLMRVSLGFGPDNCFGPIRDAGRSFGRSRNSRVLPCRLSQQCLAQYPTSRSIWIPFLSEIDPCSAIAVDASFIFAYYRGSRGIGGLLLPIFRLVVRLFFKPLTRYGLVDSLICFLPQLRNHISCPHEADP